MFLGDIPYSLAKDEHLLKTALMQVRNIADMEVTVLHPGGCAAAWRVELCARMFTGEPCS